MVGDSREDAKRLWNYPEATVIRGVFGIARLDG